MPQIEFIKKYQIWSNGILGEFESIKECFEYAAQLGDIDFYLTKRVNYKEVKELDMMDYMDIDDPKELGATGGSKKWEGKTQEEKDAIMEKVRQAKIDKRK